MRDSTSHTLMVLSTLPENRRLPSPDSARLLTVAECPYRVKSSRPASRSQTLMVLSLLAGASVAIYAGSLRYMGVHLVLAFALIGVWVVAYWRGVEAKVASTLPQPAVVAETTAPLPTEKRIEPAQ